VQSVDSAIGDAGEARSAAASTTLQCVVINTRGCGDGFCEDGDGGTVEEGMANLRDSAAFLRTKLAQHFGPDARETGA